MQNKKIFCTGKYATVLGTLTAVAVPLSANIKSSVSTEKGQIVKEVAKQRPNVILIMCDDLMAYDGIYKNLPKAITPNLDKLRDKGVNFVNAHTVAPVSAPARAAMFTGIYPHESKNYGFAKWYENDVLKHCKSLFEHLRDGGYDVYGTGKLFHHLRKSDFTQFGIRNYAGPLPSNGIKPAPHPDVPKPYSEVGPLDGTFCCLDQIPNVPSTRDTPGYKGWYDFQRNKPFRYVNDKDRDFLRDEEHAIWVKELIDRLEKGKNQRNGKPFFIGMGLSKPHTALIAPRKYFDLYPLEDIKLPKMQDSAIRNLGYLEENTPNSKGYKHYQAMQESYPNNIKRGLKMYLQAYMASVTFADDIIGSVLKALEKSSFSENTIVIFVSDHGYDFGQKNYLFKNSLWETSTLIPFYVYCPGNKYLHKAIVNRPISLIDIYPTLNDLCKLNSNTIKEDGGKKLSGHSIVPFLKEGDKTKSWSGPDVALTVVGNSKNKYPGAQNYSVRSKNWRYIYYSNGREELYNCIDDPYEWENRANDSSCQEIKKSLYEALCKLVPQVMYMKHKY